jgi:hypothetical protein
MRSRWLGIVLGCSVPVLGAGVCGCIPDPEGDFKNYNERTASFRNQEAGAFDAAPPPGSFEGLYFAACLSKLAAGRVDRVLRFYTQVKFIKDPDPATTGKISLELTPMKLGPNDGPPPTVSKDQTVGDSYKIVDKPTNAIGVYDGAIGSDIDGDGKTEVKIPGASNPISGREIEVETAAVNGRVGPGRFCSQLSGEVVVPTIITLEGDANTCLYFPVKEGDVTPTLAKDGSDFKSGCPLQ